MTQRNRDNARKAGSGSRMHLANTKLADFSIPKEMVDFRVSQIVPDLSYLRQPLQVDWDMARRLFVGDAKLGKIELDLDKARELFVPDISWSVAQEDGDCDDDEDEDWEDVNEL